MDADFQQRRCRRPVLYALGVALLPFVSGAAIAAGALPAGGNFAAGTGKISSTPNTLTVNQTSKDGIINWNGFSIGQGDSVRINNGSGATLNRVTGTSPSSIAGSLTSTGSTYLVNQNGIVVTPSGQVITGGSFVATTRDTSNSAFMGGAANLEFTGSSSGTVTNQGRISAGGDAVLIGKSVANTGNISAPNGTVGVVAGDDVVLQPSGTGLQIEVKTGSGDATTSGNIAAAQAQIDAAGGNAYALAGNNGGIVRATGTKDINGHVWLTAPSGTAQVIGTVAAQNANGSGGAIDVQGQTINVSGTLNASDVAPKGDGGAITVGSAATPSTTVTGTLAANAGVKGGNGGNIETSGEVLNTGGIKVETTAPKGQTGNWTLDPYNVTISSGSTSNNALSSGTFTPSGNDSIINVTDLQTALLTTNVTVTTGSGGSQTGDITVASPLAWSANVLTLDAWHSININAALSAGGTAGLTVKTNDGGSGGAFNFSAGNVSFASASESLTVNGVSYTLVTPALTGSVTRNYDGTLAATLSQSNYSLTGVAPADQNNVVLTVNGTPDSSSTSGTFSTKNVGSGLLVTVSGLGLNQPAGDDYFLTTTTISAGIGAISPANLTVAASPKSKVYGTPDPLLTYTLSGLQTGDSAATVLSGSLARSGGESAGTYAINQGNLAANSNYTLDFTANALSITPAMLTITANSETKVYGRNDPALTYATSGLVNATVDGAAINDTVDSVLSGNLSRAGYGTLAGEQTGSYAITHGDLAANGNYTIAFSGNALSITPATLLISPYQRTKTYGNNDPALGYDVSQLVSGVVDGVTIHDTASLVSGNLSRVGYGTLAGEQVGSYAITQGSLVANSDYNIAIASSTLTIAAPSLTVTANSGTKIYGTSDPIFTYSVSGLKNSVADGVVINDTASSALTGSLGRAAGENVGSYAITQGSLVANNYSISFNGNALRITPAALTVTANPETKLYGTADPGLSFSTSGLVNATVDGVVIHDTAASAFTGSLSRPAGENVGSYAINQGSLAANSNYSLVAFTGNVLSITPATLTITANSETRVYGRNDPALTYATSGLVNATVDGVAINDTVDSVLSGGLSRAGYGTLAGEQAGSYAITQGNLAANGNYTIAFFGNALSITPATLVISPYARSKTYGNNDPALGYDVSQLVSGVVDGVTIHDTASLVSGNLSRVDYGTLAGEQVGSYAITQGSLVANSDYNIAIASSALTITAPTLSVTANSATKIYGTSDPVLTYGVSGLKNSVADGVVINDTAASALTGSLARAVGENVGTYAITQGSLAANNYSISFNGDALRITPAALTVTANPETKLYGTTDPGLSFGTSGVVNATVDGVAINDTAASVFTGGLSRPAGENAGTYAINQGSLAANSNYTLSFTGNVLSITPATLTITAAAQTKVYGSNDPGLAYAMSGLVNAAVDGVAINDTVDSVLSGNLARASYGTLAGEQVGSYAITRGNLTANGNYTIAFTGNALSITPATLVISPFARSKVYGNSDPALGYDVSQLVAGVVDGVTIHDTAASVVSGSLSRVGYGTLAGEQVGSYSITQGSLVADSDYTVALTGSTLTITPATATVTANAQSKTYGTADPVLTYATSGLVSATVDGVAISDTAGSVFSGALARAYYGTVGSERVGSYAITQGSLAANNYAISFNGNALTITPASLTVTANPETKLYGTADPGLSFSTLGMVNASVDGLAINDTAATVLSGSIARAAGENAGSYAINQGSLAANSNYTLSFTGNALTITPVTLTITANSETKVYGGNDPALAYVMSGLVNAVVDGVAISDTVDSVLSGNLARASYGTLAGEQVGSYAITQGNLAANNNYSIAFTSNALSITPATLVISPFARSKTYGTADPALGYDVSQLVSGVVDGVTIHDTAASVVSGSLSRMRYGTLSGEQVGSYAITQGSLVADSDYAVALTGSTLTITPATVTVTANAQSKTYGSADPVLTYATSGLSNVTVDGVAINDTAVFSGALARASYGTPGSERVGSYAINQGTLATNSDYAIAFTGSTLTINPATLTVTANPETKLYGTTDPGLSFSALGLVNATVDGVAINDTAATVLSGNIARAAGENAGSYAINQGSLAATGNYTLAFTGNALTINPATLAITANAQTKSYGSNDPALAYAMSGLVNAAIDGVAISDTAASVLSGGLSRASYGTLAGEQVGSYAITQGNLAANGNYTIAFTGSTFTITPAALMVTANAQSKNYGTTDPALGYDVSQLVSGVVDGVTIHDTAASVVSGSLSRVGYGTLTGEQVGSYAITQGSLVADTDYTVALAATSLTIGPATVTVTANAQSKTYGTADPVLTYATSGLVNATVDGVAINDTAASVFSGALARLWYGTPGSERAGSYAINQGTFSANSDYAIAFTGSTLTINPATLTVTARPESKVYGSNDPALTYTMSGLVNASVDGVAINDRAATVLSGNIARAAGENAASYAINQGSLAATGNYTLAFTGNALTITPATLTVTANSETKVYGTTDPGFTVSASGLVHATVDGVAINDTVNSALSGSLSRAGYGTLAGEQVGSYAITLGSLVASNYTITLVTGNALTITPATAVVAAYTRAKVYGSNDPALGFDATQLIYGVVDGVAIYDTAASVFTGSLARAAGENAGSYAITQGSLAANSDYSIAFIGSSLSITPAALTIAANGQSKVYGTADPALTYTISGLVSATADGVAINDTVASALTGSLARAAGENAGTYTINQGSLASNNYMIAFTGNSLSIAPATLTVAANSGTKAYGTADPALTYTTTGLVNATVDGVAINDTPASVFTGRLARAGYGTLAGEQAGSYTISQGTLSANSNYIIGFTGSGLTINPATLTVNARPESKVYGTNDPSLTYSASGLVNATVDGVGITDTAASVFTGGLVRAAGENTGSYAITRGSLAANANYTVAFTGNSLGITPATLTVAANGQSKIYGTADAALSYTTSGLVSATVDGVAINDTAASVLTGSLARAAGENAGNYAISQGSLAANSNYTVAFTGSSLSITPAALTVDVNSATKVYGAADPVFTYGVSGFVNGVVDGVAINDTAASVLTGGLARDVGENAGSYPIYQGSLAANGNYAVAFIGNSLTITPAPLTVTANTETKLYGASDPALTYSTLGLVDATVDGVLINDTAASVLGGHLVRASYGTLAGEQAGGYAISQGTLSANADYTVAFSGNTLTINPATLTVAARPESKIYGSNDPSLAYTASGVVNAIVDGVAIHDTAASVLSGTLARIGYGTLAGEQAGGYAIGLGTLAANSDYAIAFSGSTLTINPATLTVAARAESKVYGNNDPALTYIAAGFVAATSDGVAINDTAASVLSGSLARVAGENAGSYAINQGSLAVNVNYTIAFTGSSLSITPAILTVTAGSETKVYGAADPALAYGASGFVNATVDGIAINDTEAQVLAGSLARAAGENAGSYAITQGSLAANSNYTIAFTGNSLSITPATLTISANSESKLYGAADPALAYGVSGLVTGVVDGVAISDTAASVLSGGLSRSGFGALAAEQVGGYAINQGTLSANSDYTLVFSGSTLTINPATLTVAARPESKVYGRNDPALAYTTAGLVNAAVDGVAINDTVSSVLTGSLVRGPGENAGSYAISQGSLAANGNYTIAFTGNSLSIAPATLTVTTNSEAKVYGTPDPTLAYSASGLVNSVVDGTPINDTAASVLSGGLSRAGYGTVAGEQQGNYAISQGTLAANSDYTIAFTGSILAISPVTLTVAAGPESKIYGNNDPAFAYTTSGLVNVTVDGVAIHDTMATVLSGGLARAAGENAGSYAITQGNLAANDNYTIAFTGNSLSIAAATLTVAASPESKAYGANDPALTYATSGLVNATVDGSVIDDTAASVLTGGLVRIGSGTVAGEQVGGYAINQGTLAANSDYIIAFTGNTLTINPATLTVAARPESKVYGSNDPALTYTTAGLVNATVDGVAINDTVSSVLTGSVVRAVGENAGSYAITQGNLAANDNYTIAFTGNALSITPATLTVIANSETKLYGRADLGLTYATSGLVNGVVVDGTPINDTAASVLSGALARAAGENAASYAISQGNLAANSNYTIAFAGNSLSITPATLTVAANAQSKVYGSNDPALTYGASGFVNATVDGVAIHDTAASVLTGNLARAVGENAGSYSIGQGSLAANSNYIVGFTGNSLSITPATLTIAANSESKVYGTTDPTLAYTTSGLVNATIDGVTINGTAASVLSGNLARAVGENVGSYSIAQGSLAANSNYTIAFTGNSLSITPAALTVAANMQSKVYGSNDPALTYTTSGLVNATIDGVPINDTAASVLGGNLARAAGENVGSYSIAQGSLAANSNYSVAFTGNSLTITPAALTVAANAQSKVYGSNDPALTYSASGLVNTTIDGVTINDTTASVLSGNLARAAGQNVGGYVIGEGSLAANGNYTIGFTGNSLSITPASLTITATGGNKAYDGTTSSSLVPTYTGLVAGDSLTGLTESYNSKDVDTATTLAVGYVLSDPSNYHVTTSAASGTITPATLSYVANAQSIQSGQSFPAFTGAVTGFVSGESLSNATTGSAVFATTATVSSPAGSYAINGSGLVANHGNYLFVQAPGNATALTITAVTASVTMVGSDLAGANLSGDNLTTVNFSGADLANANLNKTNLTNANLTNVDDTGANLNKANTTGATITTVSSYTVPTLTLTINWAGKNLSGMNLSGMDLAGYNLKGANLKGANLTGANLTGADLAGANLQGAILYKANFTDAYLAGANLQGANFQ